jgi:hypothetical protein
MRRTLKNLLLPVLLGLGILAVVGLVGSVLVVFREASAVHPLLGVGVLALVAAGVGLLIVYPVVRILRLPPALRRPEDTAGPAWHRFVTRYGRRLAKNPRLAGYEGLSRLEAALAVRPADPDAIEAEAALAVAHLDAQARDVILRHATAVFASTAISQSGRLDTAIVLSTQLRLVKEVAEIYVQRPSFRELGGLYANVGTSAFVAGEIQDSELLAVLGAPFTTSLSGFIPFPGSTPLITLLVNSLLDGSANGFLTLRIGLLARRYAGLRVEADASQVARSASLEAAGLLGGVVSHGAARVARVTRQLLLDRPMGRTSKAAKDVAGAGVSLFEKILGMAGKAGSAAGKAGSAAAGTTLSGLRVLQESLRFWEAVAEPVRDADPGTGKPRPWLEDGALAGSDSNPP